MPKHSELGDNAVGHHYPPDVAQIEMVDGSEAIFTMYLEMSLREDIEMVEGWNQDANSILIFCGLFSATVAAALGPGLPGLNVSPDDVAQRLMMETSLNASLTDIAFKFRPSFQLVNSLWFSSLILSQWAGRYLVAVRQRRTPYNQARVREYLAEGIRDSGISLLVDLMRAGQQLSFVLFAIGFLVPMFFGILNWISIVVLMWLVLCTVLYLWVTMVGILRKNSPYYTPLLSFMQFFQLLLTTLYYGTRRSNPFEGSLRRFTQGVRKATEESAQKHSQALDRRTLEWTFESLNQDSEFERFFAAIPDFCNSRAVEDPMGHLLKLNGEEKLSQALFGFMHRTVTSRLLPEPARQQRIKICTLVVEAVPTLVTWSTLRPQVYDDRCFNLTTEFLSSDMEVSRTLPGCLEHSHSALLANLIFISRIIFQFHSEHSRDKLFDVSSRTLSELSSNIDFGLRAGESQEQHRTGFYAPTISTDILRHLRKSYMALHESISVSPPGSYPLCVVQDHRHTCRQPPNLTIANLKTHLLSPLDSISPIAVVGLIDSQPSTSSDQPDGSFANPESPPLTPDAGQSLPLLHQEADACY
ncbi:hypothetical protein EI94DRAFT_1736704 [Lactarius quietus]|nr:hypothetical protein EI94DRAFT_1736704 [Lactarius quietus]